ncbi:MAG: HutD family protein, partial [Clostridiales bacterium]|nr:HutD family protein [Clostridiales bacterium]
MDVLHLTGVDYAQSIWAGGITRQIAIRPSGANYTDRLFLWRLSSARVDLEASDFTALPDYERHIAVLAGEIRLSHDGGPWIELPPFRVHA